MIEAYVNEGGFYIKGHAESKVCAGVSSLAQAIAMTCDKEVGASVYNEEEKLSVLFNQYGDKEAILSRTLARGLKAIQKDYPDQIELTITEGVI